MQKESYSSVVRRIIPNNKKCIGSYCLFLIHEIMFERMNGVKLNSNMNIYLSKKTYIKDNPYNEVLAIVGISVNHINEMNEVINVLRNCSLLNEIDGFESLNFYSEKGFNMLKNHVSIEKNMLMLFTIEPRGTGQDLKTYPNPNLCLSGGRMDPNDKNSDECMRREIYEELSIHLDQRMFQLINQNVNIIEEISHNKKYKQYYILNSGSFYFV